MLSAVSLDDLPNHSDGRYLSIQLLSKCFSKRKSMEFRYFCFYKRSFDFNICVLGTFLSPLISLRPSTF